MKKRVISIGLILSVVIGLLFLPERVEAATKPHMKTVNAKWDLKNNKMLTFKTRYAGIGMTKQKVKMTGYKVKNSKKKGYKELSFTLKFTRQWNVTPAQVHKIVNSGSTNIGAGHWIAVLDYNTGKDLEMKNNKQKVTVKSSGFKNSKPKYYKDKHGCAISLENATITVKITYPKKYKGLCIGVGGNTSLGQTKNDIGFWNGKLPFSKTSFYSKKDKSVAHFMRISK